MFSDFAKYRRVVMIIYTRGNCFTLTARTTKRHNHFATWPRQTEKDGRETWDHRRGWGRTRRGGRGRGELKHLRMHQGRMELTHLTYPSKVFKKNADLIEVLLKLLLLFFFHCNSGIFERVKKWWTLLSPIIGISLKFWFAVYTLSHVDKFKENVGYESCVTNLLSFFISTWQC